jgi:hypothetical protein
MIRAASAHVGFSEPSHRNFLRLGFSDQVTACARQLVAPSGASRRHYMPADAPSRPLDGNVPGAHRRRTHGSTTPRQWRIGYGHEQLKIDRGNSQQTPRIEQKLGGRAGQSRLRRGAGLPFPARAAQVPKSFFATRHVGITC